jgi:hypothetical protein
LPFIFIIAFTGVYLKYASVLEELIASILSDLYLRVYKVTQDGGNKLPVKVFDSNFLFLVCRLGRAPCQTRMPSGWRGYVWVLKKNGAFRNSAQKKLQPSAEIYVSK